MGWELFRFGLVKLFLLQPLVNNAEELECPLVAAKKMLYGLKNGKKSIKLIKSIIYLFWQQPGNF